MDQRKVSLPEHTKLRGYVTAWSFGLWLGPKFWGLENRGNLRVTGRWEALAAIERGNVIIAANHASIPDDFIVAGAFAPYYLFNDRYFIWCMPDRRTLESAFNIKIFNKRFDLSGRGARFFRCISIDRSDSSFSRRGVELAREVLQQGYTIILHPEEGRTWGEGNQNKPLVPEGDRVMRQISYGIFLMANPSTTFIPTWIDMPHIDDMPPTRGTASVKEPIRRLIGDAGPKYLPVGIHFGEPYRLPATFDLRQREQREAARLDLQERILRA